MTIIEQLQALGKPGHHLTMRELKPFSGVALDARQVLWPSWQKIGAARRREIVAAMTELAEDNADLDFHALLTWCLDDTDAEVRRLALEGLWESDSPRMLRRLLALLHEDSDESVRAAAAVALSRFAFLASLEELDDADADRVHAALLTVSSDTAQPLEVRRRALEGVGYFAEDEQVQRLIEQSYRDREQLLRESALVAMGRSMLPRWLPAIIRELESPSPALRYEAARAAGELADEARSAVPKLVPLCNDDDSEVALAAIWALGQVGGPGAKRVLEQLRKSQDDVRRQAALDALEELDMEGGLFSRT